MIKYTYHVISVKQDANIRNPTTRCEIERFISEAIKTYVPLIGIRPLVTFCLTRDMKAVKSTNKAYHD